MSLNSNIPCKKCGAVSDGSFLGYKLLTIHVIFMDPCVDHDFSAGEGK